MSNLQTSVYRKIREDLLNGRWENGKKLSELKLAADLGVNRNPVREALLRLASEGLLEREPGVGCRVPRWNIADVADMYHLREALEGQAARLAAQRADDSHLDQIEEEVEAIARRSLKTQDHMLAEMESHFHRHLVLASGSRSLINAWETNHVKALFYRELRGLSKTKKQIPARDPAIAIKSHRRIVAALRNRDPDEAEAATREHIRNALSWIRHLYTHHGQSDSQTYRIL